MTYRRLTASSLVCAMLSACAGSTVETVLPTTPAQTPRLPAAYPVDRLVGSWGIASFHVDKDRARTEAQARVQCKLPYVITKGPTDGVMMHVADDPVPHELTLKGAPGGKTYLGFDAPAGDEQDREILSLTDDVMVMKSINPEIDARYGTFVYVRCKKA